MFPKSSLEFLENFLNAPSPSGYEIAAAKVYREYLRDCCSVTTDVMGNTIAALNTGAKMKVMLAGHYDEIGFQVVHIGDGGEIYFRNVGGIDKLNIPSSEVEILTANGRIPGVIGKKPIHLLSQKERDKAPELADMWIDIGAESGAEAKKAVSVGDVVVIKANFKMLNANRFISKGTDDKIGAFVIAETMRALSKRQLNVAVYGVGTVQEEVGLRGAQASAFGIAPDVAFALDVGFTTDLPDIPKKLLGDTKLGAGPILNRNCDNNIVLGKILRNVANEKNIPYQESAAFRATGGTDTAAIQLSRGGVATALLSIPNRYMHSAVEMCDLRDAKAAVELLTETIASLKGDESFIPMA